jgi:acylphosphatase
MPARPRVARDVVVHGVVQGVFFRASCQAQAQRVGVAGWARNESDGTVRVYVEGEAPGVEALVAWCRRGPRGAVVDRVDIDDAEPQGLRGFSVE